MVQNPKGGGLSSSFGGDSQQIGGVKKTTDFLDKSTWVLASLLLILILLSNLTINRGTENNDSKLLDQNQIDGPMIKMPSLVKEGMTGASCCALCLLVPSPVAEPYFCV